MTKRNRRTPEEIIAATEAKLDAMRHKQAVKDAKDHPIASLITEQIATVEKQEREAKKGFGDGPQSFTSRRRSHFLWIDEINAAERVAQALLDVGTVTKSNLKGLLAEVVSNISNDIPVSMEDVQVHISDMLKVSTSDALAEAETALVETQEERNSFNTSKRQSKKQPASNTTTEEAEA